MASGLPTRRTKRADENAPPAPTRRSTLAAKPTSTTESSKDPAKSSIPVMKRSESSKTITTTKSRSALGEVTNAGKRKSSGSAGAKGKDKVERKPLSSTTAAPAPGAMPMRRTRSSVTETKSGLATGEKEKVPVGKRKIASAVNPSRPVRSRSTTASTSTTSALDISKPLAERVLNVKDEVRDKDEEEEEPVPKRRRTSTPPVADDDDDLVDEAQYDEDGQEILLSSGGQAIGMKSPKRARARDEGWDDLDAEDEGDPTMVSEYVVDAFRYMMALESKTMPDPKYMDAQTELHWQMRTILMDWLIEVHSKFRLLPETLFIASNLIDRFLSARVISLIKFQLVGLTALFVAAKYEEVICPSINHFLHMTDGGYGVEEILKAERYMLTTLGFDMSYPNPLHFLRRISKADGYDIQARTIGKYLVEISCVDQQLMQYPPSLLAAAAMWLARLCLERGEWNPNLVHYSTYPEEDIVEPAQFMLDFLLSSNFDTASSFYKKYAGKKHMKASHFMHTWAKATYARLWKDDAMIVPGKGTELYEQLEIAPPEYRTRIMSDDTKAGDEANDE